jgi:hypothetical protein
MNSNLKLAVTSFALSILFTSCKKEEEVVVSDTPKEIILPRVQAIPTGNYVAPPVQQQQQIQQQQLQQQQAVAQSNQQVVTKPGMNPPHGQAGHRCDIQVGAPLNSKPAAPAVQPGKATSQQITVPNPAQKATPLMLDPNNNPAVTAPGMNPPHGQEGHDCAIAVGAPLPKK